MQTATRQKKEANLDLARLTRVMAANYLTLGTYREMRKMFIREYAGDNWSSNAAARQVPVNLISKYIEVVAPKLISQNPRFLMTTTKRDMIPRVEAMEKWVNKEVQKMKLGTTLHRGVVDALFSFGIFKVALASPQDAANRSRAYKAGSPFCSVVDLDDFVCDTRARDFKECSYIGHRYRVPLEAVMYDRNYSRNRLKLTPSRNNPVNQGGDEKAYKIGEGYTVTEEDFEDMVDLWEVYLPRHGLVLTLADDGQNPQVLGDKGGLEGALKVQKWIGPECGPYHFLNFGLVPNNVMPKGKIGDLRVLHESTNRSYRKVMNQADRQKQVLGAGQSAVEDASRISKAKDGDVIPVTHPDQIKVFNFGGADQQTVGFADHTRNLFSWMGGNLDTLGGLASQSRTARQENLLQQNSSATIADMQEASITAFTSVGNAMAWYYWHDPVKVIRTNYEMPGMPEFSVERTVTPQDRQELPYEELDLSIDQYSLQFESPEQKAAKLTQFMLQVITPLTPVLQPQGIVPDMKMFLANCSKYMNLPELEHILSLRDPETMGVPVTMSAGGQAPRPASTERNYTRQNISADKGDSGLAMMAEASQSQEPQQ